MKSKKLQLAWLILLASCASPPEEEEEGDLWHCQEQGQFLYCVPERSIDALSGTRTAGSVPPSEGVTP
jgi:hypothetical protein